MKKSTIISLVIAFSFLAPSMALAQTNDSAIIAQLQAKIEQLQAQINAILQQQGGGDVQKWCHTFNTNLKIGHFDSLDLGEVYALHEALKTEGFSFPMKVTLGGLRSFDEDTASAVTGFQEKYQSEILTPLGLKYGTGYVGNSTRTKLNRIYGCGNVVPTAPQINSMYPQSGPVSTQVTLTGSGFSTDIAYGLCPGDCSRSSNGKNTVHFGPATISGVISYDGKTLTFQVPSAYGGCSSPASCPADLITPGGYSISVSNANGTSNNVSYTVTGGTTVGPNISGVSGPTTLQTGQQGSWTVNASDPNNGNLSYSVVWGDETNYVYGSSAPMTSQPVQQTATFTHTYNTAGTYYPKFTVTNNAGGSSQTSLSVFVSGTTQPSITVLSPNGGEVWQSGQTYNISWMQPSNSSVGIMLQNPQLPPTGASDYIGYQSVINGAVNGHAGINKYTWIIPSIMAPSASYKIWVGGYFDSYYRATIIQDYSDAQFSIIQ